MQADVTKDYLREPFLEWLDREKLPAISDFGVDLMAVETASWDRLGAEAAFVNLKGQGDFLSVLVAVIPPGQSTREQRHLYEEIVYVLEGHGSTQVIAPDGTRRSFEWGPSSMFALPLNVRHQHFNASGREPARLACTVNLPMLLNLFRNEKFIWETEADFPERFGGERYFEGQGELVPAPHSRQMWETNFVPDLASFDRLTSWAVRGAGGSNIVFSMADGSIHTHISEMPVGTYKKAHRHGPDYHVFCVTGTGYSLFWYAGDEDFKRVDWRHGVVFAPPDQMMHQHFNTGPTPARYIAAALGSVRYPLTAAQKQTHLNVGGGGDKGDLQIEYEDQDPRIHRLYLAETARAGGEVRMDAFPVRM